MRTGAMHRNLWQQLTALGCVALVTIWQDVAADQIVYSGNTTGGPRYHRTIQGIPPRALAGSFASNVRYHSYALTVTTSGLYDFFTESSSGFDPFLALYAAPFFPASPLTNVLAANDDLSPGNYLQSGFIYPLWAGRNYRVITAGYSNFDFGTFTSTITLLAELQASLSDSTEGRPVWRRPEEGAPPVTLSSTATAVPYQVVSFRVELDGRYYLWITPSGSFDAFCVLYEEQFAPENPLVNALAASDNYDSPAQSFIEADLFAGVQYFLVVTGHSNTDSGIYQANVYGPGAVHMNQLRTISGSISLEACPGRAFEATCTLRPDNQSADITRQVNVDATGRFVLQQVPAGRYQLRVRGASTLARVMIVDTRAGDVTGLNIGALPGGDAVADNVVDVLDLAALIGAFDATPGDPHWNAQCDFNCDDSVDVLDLDVLIRNFDRAGEDFS
ncbi:MAG: hypothetical protein RMJ43_07905 [Chloroherpetonaceae bacterium]|nr:hypothetical protein [Chthonomonadaceae bacterium]MDW8207746.1 hypothetical protein [Chloroherpetonaceae bacterium]